MTYTYNLHNILTIESSEELFDHAFHEYFLSDDVEDPDIRLTITKDLDHPTDNLYRHDNWFYGAEGRDLVYYEDRLLGMNDRVLVEGLQANTTEVTATPSVHRITPGSRGSYSDLVEDVIDYKCVQRGYTTLHSGTLAKDGKAILLAGFPNVGKSLCTLALLQQGFEYMGDDNGLVSENGEVFAYPSISAIGYHDFIDFIDPEDIGRREYYQYLLRVWPMQNKVVERLFDYPEVYMPDLGSFTQGERAEGRAVCCLEIGDTKIEDVDRDDMVRKLIASTDYSRPRIWQNPFVQVLEYFTDLDLPGIRERERAIIHNFLENADTYALACPQANWDQMYDEVLDPVIQESY